MATLIVSDIGDGTGANVTVDNVVGEATVYAAKWNGNEKNSPFASVHAFAGNGSSLVAFSVGAYLATVRDDTGYSSPVRFRVTDATLALHYRCVTGIRDLILSLAPPGLPTDANRHKIHKRAKRSVTEFKDSTDQGPYGVHYWPTPETRRIAYNTVEDVEYLVDMVVISGNDDDNRLSEDWLMSREVIGKSLGACILPGAPEIYRVVMNPGVIYASNQGVSADVQSVTFRCLTEQAIGVV